MKGLEKVDIEFGLKAIAHNLGKWTKKWKKKALIGNPESYNYLFITKRLIT